MNPSEKILLLINLLNSKSDVSLHEIMEKCKIAKRTAYRYLNSLSEYNIPVYFDKDVLGYRLTRKSSIHNSSLSEKDYLLAIICLKMVECNVSIDYRNSIKNVILKLLINNTLNIEHALELIEQEFDPANLKTHDFSELMSSVLIVSAISSKRKIRLYKYTSEDKNVTDIILSPTLNFENQWRVSENKANHEFSVQLKDIKKVEVLP